ncbi:MAG: leucine-rich repeat domain-containing protein [Chitinispirillales bacterium]|jgi:hypothetical protein|nr:leucine-rich repeat domain-containing protein [Chitinispirillales bacterium]
MKWPAIPILLIACLATILTIPGIVGTYHLHSLVLIPFVEKTWPCGEKGKLRTVKATLKNGTLRVFGKGAMKDYFEYGDWAPWRGRFGEFGSFSDPASLSITDVVVENGVTHIGSLAFARLPRLKPVTISASVSSIGGRSVFDYCDGI